MKGAEFLRKLHKLARKNRKSYSFVEAKGKGSHGTVYYGDANTTVKDRKKELGKGLLASMCKDLGIKPEDLD